MRKGAVILKRLGDKRNVISIQDYERGYYIGVNLP